MQEIVYVNRSCQPVIAECLGAFPMDVVGLVVEYLPPEGRKFFTKTGLQQCDMCLLVGKGELISIKLEEIGRFDVFACNRCQGNLSIEAIFEKGFISFTGYYLPSILVGEFIQLITIPWSSNNTILKVAVNYIPVRFRSSRFKLESVSPPLQWAVDDDDEYDKHLQLAAGSITGIPKEVICPDSKMMEIQTRLIKIDSRYQF